MKSLFFRSILTALLLTSSSFAGPITYTGSASAVFVDPIGGQSSGAGTNSFQFGGPNGATLSYSQTTPSFTTTNGTAFQLGSVSLSAGSPINLPAEVTMAVTLSFKTPTGIGKETFDFAVGFSTPTRDSVGAFIAAFNVGGTSTVTAPNGTKYTLELVGLTGSSTWGSPIASTLQSNSVDCAGLYVYGELTSSPPSQTPEPSALLLGAIGLGAVGACKWRKRHAAA
jgi:hypothetical protein